MPEQPKVRKKGRFSENHIKIGLGLFLDVVAFWALGFSDDIAMVFRGVGATLVVLGCAGNAREKGHSRIWGILGLISCLGAALVLSLPDLRFEEEA